jgi:hypothetical protein
MAASAIVPGVFIRSASAQVSDRYHVIELQPVEGRNRAIPYAINSDGLIVGVSLTESGFDPLPTLWVPCAGGEFGSEQFAMSAASSGKSLIDQETLLQLVGFGSSSAFIEWASEASSSERLGMAAFVAALAEGGAN